MGFRSLLKKVEAEATKELEKYISASTNSSTPDAKPSPKFDASKTNPPTRWEKAVFSMNGILAQVGQIDPDGVDVVCFPGSETSEGGTGYDIYRNVKDTKGLEALVTAHEPKGDCKMGEAMDVVLKEAFDRGFDERPCSVLVFTAGRPTDHEAVSKSLEEAAKRVNKDSDLTITFVQVGDDEWATNYLKQLDTELTTTSANGEHIDIVDTIKDEDVQKAVEEMKGGKSSSSGLAGGLVGAFTGAALGVGGVYLANKISKDKRTKGWNGRWKCIYEGDEMSTLDVKDDGEGNLEISGWDEGGTTLGSYTGDEDGFNIQHRQPGNEDEVIAGTIVDEHTIEWDDDTRWEEVPPDNMHWGAYAGAAVGGAAAAGATGYLLEKKFFNKASNNVDSDYVIIMDRSGMMAIPDTGK